VNWPSFDARNGVPVCVQMLSLATMLSNVLAWLGAFVCRPGPACRVRARCPPSDRSRHPWPPALISRPLGQYAAQDFHHRYSTPAGSFCQYPARVAVKFLRWGTG